MKRACGFTLLEVLVALAILAIGALAAMRALGVVAQSAEELRSRQLAQWSAQDRLAEIRALGLFPEFGAAEHRVVQAGRVFRIREEIKATPNPLFRRVDVRVSAEADDRALAQLTGFAVRPLR